jgi:hypothetical protein
VVISTPPDYGVAWWNYARVGPAIDTVILIGLTLTTWVVRPAAI